MAKKRTNILFCFPPSTTGFMMTGVQKGRQQRPEDRQGVVREGSLGTARAFAMRAGGNYRRPKQKQTHRCRENWRENQARIISISSHKEEGSKIYAAPPPRDRSTNQPPARLAQPQAVTDSENVGAWPRNC